MQNIVFKCFVGKKAAKTKFKKSLIHPSRWKLLVGVTRDQFLRHNNLVSEKKRAQAKRIEMHRKKNEEKRASRMQCL
jgi:hypothetical protein